MSTDGNLGRVIPTHLPAWHFQRVETGGTGQGIPDLNYCAPGGAEGWIENKRADHWAVDLEPEQVAWLSRRARVGGRVWVAVRRARKTVDELWLVPGARASELKRDGLRAPLDSHHWAGGPARWDWAEVARLLAG